MTAQLAKKTPAGVRAVRTCLVIGGGLAGLAAADRAKGRGWHVHLFEAQPELGGRVKSYRFHNPVRYCDLVCELGGEWIGRHHTTMLGLVKRFHLGKFNHQYALSFWDADRQVQTIYRPSQSPFSKDVQGKLEDFGRTFRKLRPAGQKKLDMLDWWTSSASWVFRRRLCFVAISWTAPILANPSARPPRT